MPGVADQALVGRPLLAALVPGEQLDGLAAHRLAGPLGPGAERDRHVRGQPEAQVVAVGRLDLVEDHLGRLAQLDQDLGRGHRQRLAGADVDRHAAPAPRVEVEAQRREGLDRSSPGRRP